MTCEYMSMCTLQCIGYCTISMYHGSLYLKLMNSLRVYAFAWRIVFNFTSSSFVLTCPTGTMRMTSLQPTVFQTCLWRLIWMTVSPETRAPLWGPRSRRYVQSTAVPQKLEQVKKNKKKHTLLSYIAISYVSFVCNVEPQTFSASVLIFHLLCQNCLQAFSRLLSLDIKITWMQKYVVFFFCIVLTIPFN